MGKTMYLSPRSEPWTRAARAGNAPWRSVAAHELFSGGTEVIRRCVGAVVAAAGNRGLSAGALDSQLATVCVDDSGARSVGSRFISLSIIRSSAAAAPAQVGC